mgnify:CR=1 FL=1
MSRHFCSFLLFRVMGWKVDVTVPMGDKYIIALAPHTSIPVYRNKKMSMTDQLAQVARERDNFHLCITPEGTRSRTEEWKKGFYYIALKAGLPILLYGVDYPTKTIRCTQVIIPNGNIDEQMNDIKTYFKDFTGRHPEKFATGLK